MTLLMLWLSLVMPPVPSLTDDELVVAASLPAHCAVSHFVPLPCTLSKI